MQEGSQQRLNETYVGHALHGEQIDFDLRYHSLLLQPPRSVADDFVGRALDDAAAEKG